MSLLLREPMVLEIGPYRENARIGEIVVFEYKVDLLAHRVIEVKNDVVHTCSDATPWRTKTLRATDIVSKVVAVYVDERPNANGWIPGYSKRGLDQWILEQCRARVLTAWKAHR